MYLKYYVKTMIVKLNNIMINMIILYNLLIKHYINNKKYIEYLNINIPYLYVLNNIVNFYM